MITPKAASMARIAVYLLIVIASVRGVNAAAKMMPRELKNKSVYVSNKPCVVNLRVDEFGDPVSFTLLKPCIVEGASAAKGTTIAWRPEFKTFEQFKMKSKKPRIINGVAYASDVINYAGEGGIHYATLAQDTEIQGILFRGGKRIHYHRNGKVLTGFVAQDTVVEGKTITAKHPIALDSQGRLADLGDIPGSVQREGAVFRYGTLKKYEYVDNEEPVEYRVHEYAASGILADAQEFSCYTGKVNEGWSVMFAADTELSVHTRDELKNKKGAWSTIKRGTLASESMIHGKKYAAGKTLTFGLNCKVVGVE